MFIVSVCIITHESRFALGFSSFSFCFVSHLCMQIYACHDETLRGLTGSIFKECGAVNPAFLSYLNFNPLENHRSDCNKCYNPLLWLSTKLLLLIVFTSITTANFNRCFLVLVYNSI